MFKATTPKFNLIIPYMAYELDKFSVTMAQQGINIYTFEHTMSTETEDRFEVEDHLISFSLTQEESNIFVHRYPIHLQLRILLVDGTVVASNVEHINVHNVLDDTILSHDE